MNILNSAMVTQEFDMVVHLNNSIKVSVNLALSSFSIKSNSNLIIINTLLSSKE
jgi:hypothetical protein